MSKQQTRILFTIPNFITAGSGQALLHIVKRLDPKHFSPTICVSKRGGKLEKEIEALGIRLIEYPFTVPARPLHTLPFDLWKTARPFRKYRFNIWHSYHYLDDYTEPMIARLSGAKGWIYTKKNMSWGSRAWQVRTWLATRIAAQNTTMVEEFFTNNRIKSKVRFLPRGVDYNKFHPDTRAELNIRHQLNLPDHAFIIGVVAHLVPVKGHNILIKALKMLSDNIHIVFAGKLLDEIYVNTLKNLCIELSVMDRVHFLGNIENIPALHTELDLFVLPTLGRLRMEGCPVALLEALACGTCSIATDIAGSRDIIINGKVGLLVPPEDPESLALAIKRLHDDIELRQQMEFNARQHILSNYSIDREVAQHEALYRELLNG